MGYDCCKHMEKHLGEKIKLKHIPGARDIPGFNKFHNKLRFDEKNYGFTWWKRCWLFNRKS